MNVNDLPEELAEEAELFQFDAIGGVNGDYLDDNNYELSPKAKITKEQRNNKSLL